MYIKYVPRVLKDFTVFIFRVKQAIDAEG